MTAPTAPDEHITPHDRLEELIAMTTPTSDDLRLLADESGHAIDQLLDIASRRRARGDEAGAAEVEETVRRMAQLKQGAQDALKR